MPKMYHVCGEVGKGRNETQNEITWVVMGAMHLEAERGEEPLVLARGVLLLENLLDLLLGVLALRRLLEGVLGNGTLETLELESVTGGHEVVVRDDLNERLDLGSLGDLLGTHALGHLLGVSLNAGSDNEGERLVLGAVIELLDDDNLRVIVKEREMRGRWECQYSVCLEQTRLSLQADPTTQLPNLRECAKIVPARCKPDKNANRWCVVRFYGRECAD